MTTVKREVETDPEEIKFDNMVDLATIGLKNIRNNEQFASLVHSMVAEQFDGDDNVLLKNLSERCADIGIDLKNEMITALNEAEREDLVPLVDEAINGFTYDDRVVYLQIYIPFFNTVNKTTVPVLGANHDEGEVVSGFGIEGTEIEISEAFAEINLTWILSVNETVDNNGDVPPVIPAGRGSAVGDYTIQAKSLIMTNPKEGFPNGKAEIGYARYRSSLGNCVNGVYVMGNFGKYAKSQNAQPVGGADSWFVPIDNNFSLTNSYSDRINILIFERDVREKFNKEREVVPGCHNTLAGYRSKQDPWGNLEIKNPWIYSPTFFTYSFDWTTDMDGLKFKVEMQ